MKRISFTEIAIALMGVLLCVGPFFIFGVCPSGEHMILCRISCKVEVLLGILLVMSVLMLNMARENKCQKIILSMIVIINIMGIMIPALIIGGCHASSMRCRMITFPVIYCINIASIVLSVGRLVAAKRREGKVEL